MTDAFTLSLRLLVDLTAARRAGDDPGADLLRRLLAEMEPDLSGRERAAWAQVQIAMETAWPREDGEAGHG